MSVDFPAQAFHAWFLWCWDFFPFSSIDSICPGCHFLHVACFFTQHSFFAVCFVQAFKHFVHSFQWLTRDFPLRWQKQHSHKKNSTRWQDKTEAKHGQGPFGARSEWNVSIFLTQTDRTLTFNLPPSAAGRSSRWLGKYLDTWWESALILRQITANVSCLLAFFSLLLLPLHTLSLPLGRSPQWILFLHVKVALS